jgi:hypothetical protein
MICLSPGGLDALLGLSPPPTPAKPAACPAGACEDSPEAPGRPGALAPDLSQTFLRLRTSVLP